MEKQVENGDVTQRYWAKQDFSQIPGTFSPSGKCRELLESSQCVLDLGCGARALSAGPGRNARTTVGVDINANALRHLATRDLNVFPVLAEASMLPFRAQTFDAVLIVALMTVVPRYSDVERIVCEVRRVLRPGGALYVGDFLFDPNSPTYRSRYRPEDPQTLYAADEAGRPLYLARHWTEEELFSLTQGMRKESFEVSTASSRSGNKLQGFEAIFRQP
ncbi:class I SAM-dependent methyltransferase [Longispora sp. K20-0274]|uniref:class I SAM-dependent methyltransferase n=1 Tax=Longispora sp. K20-0274 TaxID=3088255 RepID=UPI00399AF2CC